MAVPDQLGDFRLLRKLAMGGFGELWIGKDKRNDRTVAIKLEHVDTFPSQIKIEEEAYHRLERSKVVSKCPHLFGFAQKIACGTQDEWKYLVMSILGHNLNTLVNKTRLKVFSVKTGLMLADQAITRLELLHQVGYLHRDLKPENMVMGRGRRAGVLYLIDFGLCKPYVKHEAHIPMQRGKRVMGTPEYMARAMHAGLELGRKDDLESLAYVFISLLKGQLPWQNNRNDLHSIRQLKESTSIESLCEGLPNAFTFWMRHVEELKFDEAPDYNAIRRHLHEDAADADIVFDLQYDWM